MKIKQCTLKLSLYFQTTPNQSIPICIKVAFSWAAHLVPRQCTYGPSVFWPPVKVQRWLAHMPANLQWRCVRYAFVPRLSVYLNFVIIYRVSWIYNGNAGNEYCSPEWLPSFPLFVWRFSVTSKIWPAWMIFWMLWWRCSCHLPSFQRLPLHQA